MNTQPGKWYTLGALGLFAVGVAAAAVGTVTLYGKLHLVSSQQTLLSQAEDLARRDEAVAAAREKLKTANLDAPANMDALLQQAGLTRNVSDTREAVTDMGGGWSSLTHEITITDVVLADLDRFLVLCQDGRPPWVPVDVSLRASPFESGRAQVILKMQALRSQKD